MATTATAAVRSTGNAQTRAVRQAYHLLHIGFVVAPILAGVDKFTNLLTDWTQYLAPSLLAFLPLSAQGFMYIVGIIEIVAGLVVLFRPRFGGYLVAAWLGGIILSLLLIPGYFDVALRDLGLLLGALALARLAEAVGQE